MKIYVCVDMEGIGGIVHPMQIMEGEAMYEEGRALLTDEVNAVVEALKQAGAAEIIVRDMHGAGMNFIAERLHPDASYVMGATGFDNRFPGLDDTFDGAMLVGYHAMAGTPQAIRDHTYSSQSFAAIALNGRPIGEIGLDSLLLGLYGVPVLLVTGDEAACREAEREIAAVSTYSVKRAWGRHSAKFQPPLKVREEIGEAVAQAVRNRQACKPLFSAGPYALTVRYASTDIADSRYCDGIHSCRTDGVTIEWTAEDDLVRLFSRALK